MDTFPKNTSTNSCERNHRIAWAGQTRRTCHGSTPRPTRRKSQLQYANIRKEQNHTICAFIRMLHGTELLSYTCNVMRQSSAVYKTLPSTFAQALPWHPWDQSNQQNKIQNTPEQLSIHLYDLGAWYQDRKVVYLKYHLWYTSKLINTPLRGQCRVWHRKVMKAKTNKSSTPYRRVIHPSLWHSCMVPRQKKLYISNVICDTHPNRSIPLSEVSATCDIAKPWKQKQTTHPTLSERLSIHLYDRAAWYQDRKVL